MDRDGAITRLEELADVLAERGALDEDVTLTSPVANVTYLGGAVTFRKLVQGMSSGYARQRSGWPRAWDEARALILARLRQEDWSSPQGARIKLKPNMPHDKLEAWAAAHAMAEWLDAPLTSFAEVFELRTRKGLPHYAQVRDLFSRKTYQRTYGYTFPERVYTQAVATLGALVTMREEGQELVEERLDALDASGLEEGAALVVGALASYARSRADALWLRPDGLVPLFNVTPGRAPHTFEYVDEGLTPCGLGRAINRATLDLSQRRLRVVHKDTGHGEAACAVCVDAALTFAELVLADPEQYEDLIARWRPIDPARWLEEVAALTATDEVEEPDDHWFCWRVTGARHAGQRDVSPGWARHKKSGKGFVTTEMKRSEAIDLYTSGALSAADAKAFAAWLIDSNHSMRDTARGHADLMRALSACEHVYHHDRKSRALRVELVEPSLELVATPDGAEVMLRLGDELLDIDAAHERVTLPSYRDSVLDTSIDLKRGVWSGLYVSPSHKRMIERWFEDDVRRIAPDELPGVVARAHAFTNTGAVGIDASLRGERMDAQDTARLMLRFNGYAVRARLAARPLGAHGAIQVPGEGAEVVYGLRDGAPVHAVRGLTDELEAARLAAAELDLDLEAAHEWEWQLDDLDAALDLVALAQDLHERGELEVLWDTKRPVLAPTVAFEDLAVDIGVVDRYLMLGGEIDLTDHGGASLSTLLALSREGRRWLQLSGGGWAKIESRLSDALANLAAAGDDSLSPLHAPQLLALEEHGAQVRGPARWLELHDRVRDAAALEPELPADLDATLRPYQREGFSWLARLAYWATGAILADDMGLGKTVQALALLLTRKHMGPALVVAPTSLGSNWRREAAGFAPTLAVSLIRTGAQLDELDDPGPGEVWVMSYGLAARHAERIESICWSTHVLDEAQAVKNPDTSRARTSRAVRADFTLALSGTPVENRALELWSLCEVVTPGLLPHRAEFERRYARVIERGGPADAARARRALAATVSPFVLRRTKREVAVDLPERIDVRVDVELSAPARALYDELRRAAMLHQLDADADAFQLLAALTRLRQIACHPKLFLPDSTAPSSKLTVLRERVAEALADGSRCLVFSQFTTLLDLAQADLTADGVACARLDGSMSPKAREDAVASFQSGEANVFLLSIKAGGTGLNLTAATSVFILDPWWNPAVEDQAADRAHRIGQTEPVTVYRLVARGTIEEAIYELHADKRELAEALLSGASSSRPLDVAELRRLISITPEDFDEDAEPPPPTPPPTRDTSGALDAPPPDDLDEAIDAALDALASAGELAESSRNVYHRGIHDALAWARANDLPLDASLLEHKETYRADVDAGAWDASKTLHKTIGASLKWLVRALEEVG